MIRIVVGGQINKQEIAAFTKNFMGNNATVDVKNDLDATMAIQAGQYDYYIGACNTGGGGAGGSWYSKDVDLGNGKIISEIAASEPGKGGSGIVIIRRAV